MSATSVLCTATLLRGGGGNAIPGGDRWAAFKAATYAQYFARPRLRSRLLQFLFFMLSFSMFISGFALFAERRFTWQGQPFGPREIGYIFAAVGLFGIVLQGAFIGRLVRRFGEAPLVLTGFLSVVVGYAMLGWVTSTVLLLVTAILSGFGNGVLRPALTSLITYEADRHEQGVVLGIAQALTSMASIVAPIAAGILIQQGLLGQWAWLAGLMALIGWVLAASSRDVQSSPGRVRASA